MVGAMSNKKRDIILCLNVRLKVLLLNHQVEKGKPSIHDGTVTMSVEPFPLDIGHP